MTRDELLTAAVRAGCAAGYAMECQHPYCGCATTPTIVNAAIRLALDAAEKIAANKIAHNIRTLMPPEESK